MKSVFNKERLRGVRPKNGRDRAYSIENVLLLARILSQNLEKTKNLNHTASTKFSKLIDA